MEIIFLAFIVIQSFGVPVEGGEYCYHNNKYEYCSGYCCTSEDDYCCSDWGWIAGVVVGAIIFLAIVGSIIFLICHKMKAKKAQTVHVQMISAARQPYQSNTLRTSRRPYQQSNAGYTSNTYGTGYNNAFLPPPPPYSQIQDASTAYPPPPPYPGTPAPPSSSFSSGGNGAQTYTPQITSHMHASGDIAYPPPPVS